MDDLTEKSLAATCIICGDTFIPDGRRKSRCSKMHYRDCNQCKKPFLIEANMKVDTAYCSKSCSGASRARKTKCPVCGEGFSKRSKTCSKECSVELRNRTKDLAPLEKSCSHCGDSFLTTSGTAKYCDGVHTNKCEVCDELFEVDAGSALRACSSSCRGSLINSDSAKEKKRKVSQERFGTDSPFQSEEVKDKIKSFNLDKYGYESHLSAPEIREKIESTNLERYGSTYFNGSEEGRNLLISRSLDKYGVPNPFMSEEVKAKIEETNIERYGSKHHMQNEDILLKTQNTNLERYGVPNVLMDPEIKERASRTFADNLSNGSVFHHRVSKINRFYADILVKQLNAEVTFEEPFGKYFSDLKVIVGERVFLIDINPTISHNSERAFSCVIGGCEDFCEKHLPIAKRYHQNRALTAMSIGVKLIQWYDWNGGPEKLVDYLAPKLMPAKKFSARKLMLRNLSSKVTNEFLARFHIQGASRGQSYRYGLFDGNELVAVATFGKSRFGAKEDFEFLRYAVASGYVVYGGAGSLLKRFIDEVGSGSIISYVDLDHTTAENTFLHTVGFTEKSVSSPGLIWYNPKSGKSVRGSSLIMQGADRLLGTSYGSREESGFGNKEIMLLEGFLPVNTSGNRIFSLSF